MSTFTTAIWSAGRASESAAAGTRLGFDAAEAWHVWHDLEALALEA